MGEDTNAMVSMRHHFFGVHGLGEKDVHLHADHCGDHNKNDMLTGLHENITLFMIAGHTLSSPQTGDLVC